MSKITLIAASLAITSAVLTACVPTTQSGNGDNIVTKPTADLVRVEGQVAYRERMAIPADAVIIIRIDNIARADQRAVTVEEKRIVANGQQVPIAFSISVPRSRLPGPGSNNLNVRIEDNQGKILWIADSINGIEAVENSDIVQMGTIILVKA